MQVVIVQTVAAKWAKARAVRKWVDRVREVWAVAWDHKVAWVADAAAKWVAAAEAAVAAVVDNPPSATPLSQHARLQRLRD